MATAPGAFDVATDRKIDADDHHTQEHEDAAWIHVLRKHHDNGTKKRRSFATCVQQQVAADVCSGLNHIAVRLATSVVGLQSKEIANADQ